MYQDFHTRGGPRNVTKRVKNLRAEMKVRGVDAFLIPHTNQFQSEYLPDHDERLLWVSGFSGSAGSAILTARKGALFVDGRYTIQAASETNTKIFEICDLVSNGPLKWSEDNLAKGQVLGIDPNLHTLSSMRRIKEMCKTQGIKLKELPKNPIDQIWTDQPDAPMGEVSLQPDELSGCSALEKIQTIREKHFPKGPKGILLTSPDSIAWLLNIRGKDIAHTPIALCYLLVNSEGKNDLFIAPGKIAPDIADTLSSLVNIHAFSALKSQLEKWVKSKKSIQIDPNSCSYSVTTILEKSGARISEKTDPCVMLKAIKNDAEIAGMKRAHERDGLALCRFLMWLDEKADSGRIDEVSAAEKLEALRVQTGKLKDISFPTISGYGPNGAIVHYRVSYDSKLKLKSGSLYLCDSGAQYLDGTTDVTRTVAIGKPTKAMRVHYTLVLKGHIALSSARFPEDTNGAQLDALARRPLWDHGLDYDHGTGHGVGSYLGVHEGPQNISKRGMVGLKPGMIISNEPGYYLEGAYGIRIENLLLVNPASKRDREERDMLSFTPLTLAPLDRRLIDLSLLTEEERAWINRYHERVFAGISSRMLENEREWLKGKTAAL